MSNLLNLANVLQSFRNSLKEDDDIIVDAYLEGYNELAKFLNLIGPVFSFVNSDVKNKLKVMERHRTGEDSVYYETFKKMMMYELEAGLHDKIDFVSGSRTMLRLHRGLDFIRVFLKRLFDGEGNVGTCAICQSSYNDTLAEYHPWYIRKASTLAMHTLPNRIDLMKKIFGLDYELTDAVLILPDCLRSCDEVYRRVEQLYSDFDLHGLP